MPSSSNWQIWRFRMAMSPIAALSCKRYCCAKSCIPPALARVCLGVPQTGEDDQVKIIGTLCRKIIHQDFIDQLKQGDTSQVLALLNQTLTS